MTEAWGLTVGASVLAGVWLGTWAIPLVLGFVLIMQLVRGTICYRALTFTTIALVIGVLRGDADAQTHAPSDLHLSNGALGQVMTIPKSSPGGARAVVHVSEVSYEDDSSVPVSFNAVVRLPDGAEVASGDHVEVRWIVDPLDRLPPGYARYVASRGAIASAFAWSVTVEQRGSWILGYVSGVQERLTEGLRAVVPGDAGSLAAGIVTGDDASLGDGARDAFLRTGTTHITAVSGSNVAMVLALWNMIFYSSRTRRAFVVQIAIVITIWLYAVLVGLEPSAVRAAIVASLAMFSGRFGRRADPLTILILTTGGMVLWNPNYTQMVGFWLSVVASFAIISRMPGTGKVTLRLAMKRIAQGVLLAQAATMPLVMMTFGTWSFSSILANLLIQPSMTLAFPLTFVLAVIVLIVPTLAPVVAWVPALLLDFVLTVVTRLSPLGSPIQVDPASVTAFIGIGVPCGLVVIAASNDAERWVQIFRERWSMAPRVIAATLLVPVTGIAIGVITTMVT